MNLIKKEFLFFSFLLLFIVFLINDFREISNINSYINWGTIRALSVLLLLTTAIKISNFFEWTAVKFLNFLHTEKSLAFFFITLSVFLSMFLTNDITLFIVVPITLALKQTIKNDITKLVIFEAIAVNAGSLLTPLGNPQNLFLYKIWGTGFLDFTKSMFPMFAVCLATLYVFIFLVFPNTRLQTEQVKVNPPKIDRFLFISSLLLLAVFITALELHFVTYLIPALILWFFIVKKEVFFKFDWFLIITFMLMFIDFNILSKYPFLQNSINYFDLNFKNVMNLSILTSQIMSNVPAAIFMSKFSHNYLAIAYGVNIAGNGFIIASLANIIAIRMLKKGFVEFHKYSIPYFLITYIITVLFIF